MFGFFCFLGVVLIFICCKFNIDFLRVRVKFRVKFFYVLFLKGKEVKRLVDFFGEFDKEIEREYVSKVE